MGIDLALILQIFVLLNPLASFSFLIAAHSKKMNVRMIALKAVLTAFAIAVLILAAGPILFRLFGITLDSFRIAGGIVLLLLGISMVRPKEEEDKKVGNIEGMITIIATPMLTGPATISFITIKSYELPLFQLFTGILGAFILVSFVFFMFTIMVDKTNPKLISILSRILGLFLTAVAIEMMAKGIEGLIFTALRS